MSYTETVLVTNDVLSVVAVEEPAAAVVVVAPSPQLEQPREGELVEEDLVAVSYMGDELDLETVGDIIAIIEEKVVTAQHCHYAGT